jgi:predicted dehydrogenase
MPWLSSPQRIPTPGLLEVAAKAGKAAFTEKPIALDLAETARVVDLIREAGIPVQLGFMRRFDPGYARAKQKIDTGELSRIELFRALSRERLIAWSWKPFSARCKRDANQHPARKTLWKPLVGVGSDQELARRPAGED